MCASENGFYLPALAGVKAFTGHYNFTIDYEQKNRLVQEFFNGSAKDDFRKKLLQEYHVDYVFYTEIERGLGDFDPYGVDFLRPVLKNSQATVFKVEMAR